MSPYRDKLRLRSVAGAQAGRVTRRQLNLCGIDNRTITRWIAQGWLIRRLPKVYALGHAAPSREARLWEAVLYAGPGAMLSHMTAAQWCGYIKYTPERVHVSTARKIASVPGIAVHPRRELTRTVFNHVPVTTASQTLLDLATVRPDLLPRALGQLDYRGQLDTARIAAALGSGVRGAAALRGALTTYDPNVARLNDEFEIDFYALCADWGIDPLPIPNVEIQPGLIVDALWPEHHLGVELDGRGNHHSDPQLLRDADRDLICRRLGLSIIRYRRAQLRRSPDAVREDLQAQLVRQATTAKAA